MMDLRDHFLAAVGGCRISRAARSAFALAIVYWVTGYAAVGGDWVRFSKQEGDFALAENGQAPAIFVEASDYPGVRRVAGDLQADIQRVARVKPELTQQLPTHAGALVVVGSLGHSPLVDRLAADGKIDVHSIKGQWESYIIATVDHPTPEIDRALVIAGSDKRGAIYGAYEISQQIGVSPWYWWADVAPTHRDALYIQSGAQIHGPPSVKYRGIFLNDEAPDLTNWVHEKFGDVAPSAHPPIPPGIPNYNHEFYARIFEVLLRLKGNYLWPAMWNNAFNEDDPENPRLADLYGIVMGTSHQEPMMRAQKEWDRRYLHTIGPWNYAQHPDVMEQFWREGVRRNKNYENLITIGLRGANDTAMAPGGPAENMALLQKIVEVQRSILQQEVNPDLKRVPQLWCLYKEVQEFYEAGMKVPDDVTLLWAEDNWGNVRRLPTPQERGRSGGAGVYYHFDYHGAPRSYQWINTTQNTKIWDQMSLAKRYGADRVWIVNMGHFKGYELPLEYFMALAWDTDALTNMNVHAFTVAWAERQFGPAHAEEIAQILDRYTQYNARRKPELLAPDTYSLVNYNEAEDVVADYQIIADQAQRLYDQMPPDKRDAFYELVLFPAKAGAVVNQLYVAAGKNYLYAAQGRASANDYAAQTRSFFQTDTELMNTYNHALADGRWDHFMDQSHLGYLNWRDPPENSLRAISFKSVDPAAAEKLGVAVEGSVNAWPGTTSPAALPLFDRFNGKKHYIDVFRRGQKPFAFSIRNSTPWISLATDRGTTEHDQRIWISIDWTKTPVGEANATLVVQGAGESVPVAVNVFNPAISFASETDAFVETNKFVSIEAPHTTSRAEVGSNRWIEIPGYGATLSGLRADGPADGPTAPTARVEYRIHFFDTGAADVGARVAPTLNFDPRRGLRYAVSIDDETPQIITLVPKDYRSGGNNPDWEKSVADNLRIGHSHHKIKVAGDHTLKIWMVDPGVVLEKIVVDLGGLQPSYLGPPESYFGRVK